MSEFEVFTLIRLFSDSIRTKSKLYSLQILWCYWVTCYILTRGILSGSLETDDPSDFRPHPGKCVLHMCGHVTVTWWASRQCGTRFWLTQSQQRKPAIWCYFEDVRKNCMHSQKPFLHTCCWFYSETKKKEKHFFSLQIHIWLKIQIPLEKSWTWFKSPLRYE